MFLGVRGEHWNIGECSIPPSKLMLCVSALMAPVCLPSFPTSTIQEARGEGIIFAPGLAVSSAAKLSRMGLLFGLLLWPNCCVSGMASRGHAINTRYTCTIASTHTSLTLDPSITRLQTRLRISKYLTKVDLEYLTEFVITKHPNSRLG